MVPTGNPIVSTFTSGMVLNMVIWHWWLLFTTCLKEARREEWNWCKLFVFVSWNYQLHPVTCSSCITCKKHVEYSALLETEFGIESYLSEVCAAVIEGFDFPPKKVMQVACSTQPPSSVLQPNFLITALQGSWWRILALILNVLLPTDRAKNSQNSSKIPWSMFYCTSLLTSITEVKTAVKEKWKRGFVQVPWPPCLTTPHISAEMSECEIWSSWSLRKAECSLAALHSSILVQLCKGIYCNWVSCQSWHTTPIKSVMYCK